MDQFENITPDTDEVDARLVVGMESSANMDSTPDTDGANVDSRLLGEAAFIHPRCAKSEDALYDGARKQSSLLERHEGKMFHGYGPFRSTLALQSSQIDLNSCSNSDVCRDRLTGDFFCPQDCYALLQAPFW